MKYLDGPDCIEAQLCRADFYYEFTNALQESGGNYSPQIVEAYQKMRFSDVVKILAQNGLRMKYFTESRIENY